MAKLDPALWRDMMAYLRRKHAPICRQWFEELRPVSLDAGLLKISTTNTIQQNYLQRKCLDQFTEAAQATTNALVAVRFINDDHLRDPAPLEAAPSVSVTATVVAEAPVALSSGAGGTATLAPPAVRPAPPAPLHRIETLRPEVHADLFEQPVITPDYAFDTFVTGPGNQLAYAAAVAVANQPGSAYNPLFVHGGVGLGKTHLLQAICQKIMHRGPQQRICYLSCDAFMNQFLDCVQRGLMDQFRHRYRHVDVLVIDDIHFLGVGNRERTQEEFFHTFNELHQARKQIILSSDAPPAEIPQLEERLVSRFQWGLVVSITRPDYETRMAIVKAKARLRNLTLPDDVAAYIANRIDSNARELEGALTTLQASGDLQNHPIDLALAQRTLGEGNRDHRLAQVTLQNIVDTVTAYYNVKLSDLQSKRRHKSITQPRQVCMWLARKRTRFSLQEIGAFFGGRDHTTVMHSIQTIEDRTRADTVFAQQIQQLEDRISKIG